MSGMVKSEATRLKCSFNAGPAALPGGGETITAAAPCSWASNARRRVTTVELCVTPTEICSRSPA